MVAFARQYEKQDGYGWTYQHEERREAQQDGWEDGVTGFFLEPINQCDNENPYGHYEHDENDVGFGHHMIPLQTCASIAARTQRHKD